MFPGIQTIFWIVFFCPLSPVTINLLISYRLHNGALNLKSLNAGDDTCSINLRFAVSFFLLTLILILLTTSIDLSGFQGFCYMKDRVHGTAENATLCNSLGIGPVMNPVWITSRHVDIRYPYKRMLSTKNARTHMNCFAFNTINWRTISPKCKYFLHLL